MLTVVLMTILCQQRGRVVLLPPDFNDVDFETSQNIFMDYRRELSRGGCYYGYNDMLLVLNRVLCGTPTSSLSQVFDCLKQKNVPVLRIVVKEQEGGPSFSFSGSTWENEWDVFAEKLREQCNSFAFAKKSPAIYTSGFEAVLLSRPEDHLEDGIRVSVGVEKSRIVLQDTHSTRLIAEIPFKDVVGVVAGKQCEVVTETDVYYLHCNECESLEEKFREYRR